MDESKNPRIQDYVNKDAVTQHFRIMALEKQARAINDMARYQEDYATALKILSGDVKWPPEVYFQSPIDVKSPEPKGPLLSKVYDINGEYPNQPKNHICNNKKNTIDIDHHSKSPSPTFSNNYDIYSEKDGSSMSDEKSISTVTGVSLFIKNWAKDGSYYDIAASKLSRTYPDGDTTILYDEVEGYDNKRPRIGWASFLNNKKYSCLGVYVCPNFWEGCYFRERPRCPRRDSYGKNEKNERNHDPAGPRISQKSCIMHPDLELVHHECDCSWKINKVDGKWLLEHNGSHNHL